MLESRAGHESDPPSACAELLVDDSHRILAANPAAHRLLLPDDQSLVGRDFRDLLSRPGRLFFQSHVSPRLGATGEFDEIYVSLSRTDGSEVSVLMAGRRAWSEDGTHRDRLSFLPMRKRAIVENQLVEARDGEARATLAEQVAKVELQRAQAQMAISERLAALGTLAAGVAHELNNPLTYVVGNLALLNMSLPETADAREYLHDVCQGVERIRSIVAGLKVFSRAEEDRRVLLDLNQVATTSAQLVASQIRHSCQLSVDLCPTSLAVEGDEGRLAQVIVNLLLNAGQALEAERGSGQVRLRTRRDGEWALLEVEDNGPGVPEALRDRIFDPFVTSKPVGEGTGLGLYLVHGIVSSLDGTVTLDPDCTSGARFQIRLPLRQASKLQVLEAPVEPHDSIAPREASDLEQYRVLVVDDDIRVGKVLVAGIRPLKAQSTTGGLQALELVESGQPFDLIICDLTMPRMSGTDVYRRLLELDPGWRERFIFVTGGALDAESAAFLESGEVPFLTKPVSPGLLKEACLELLSRHSPGAVL